MGAKLQNVSIFAMLYFIKLQLLLFLFFFKLPYILNFIVLLGVY